MSLDIVLEYLKERNEVVSWCDYFEAAVDHLWTWNRIFSMIEYSLQDIYGKEYANEVLDILKVYVVRKVNGAWATYDFS